MAALRNIFTENHSEIFLPKISEHELFLILIPKLEYFLNYHLYPMKSMEAYTNIVISILFSFIITCIIKKLFLTFLMQSLVSLVVKYFGRQLQFPRIANLKGLPTEVAYCKDIRQKYYRILTAFFLCFDCISFNCRRRKRNTPRSFCGRSR